MKFLYVYLLLSACPAAFTVPARGQWQSRFGALQKNHITVDRLEKNPADSAYYLRTPYAGGSFVETEKIRENAQQIRKIMLVYTTYKLSPAFDQEKLNYRRLVSLRKAAPELFDNPAIEWQLVGQTGCTSQKEGKNFFHGFVIIPHHTQPAADLRGYQDETTHERELEYMDSIIHKMTVDTLADTILYFTKSKWDDRLGFVPDSAYAVWSKSGRKQPFKLPKRDSTVLVQLNRLENPGTILVVADVTGSMSPYNTQMLLWLQQKLKTGAVGKVVFFNDGNARADFHKKPGSTGGIYIAPSPDFVKITQVLKTAMKNGNGGDIQENNVEAILEGLKACPECESVVMIADNSAPVRDLELADDISRPVYIILCGKGFVALQDYVFLARKTGGRVMGKEISSE